MGRRGHAWVAAAGYVAAFACLTFPLLLDPEDRVMAAWSPDLEHSFWVQWWFATAIDSDDHALFRTHMIDFPQHVDLQLADLNLAVNVPFYLMGAVVGPAAAWNAALFASFLLAALLLRRLALRLGASDGPAWLAGLLFAGSPYWVATALNGWCYLVHIWVLPLVFLAVLSLRDRPGALTGAALGLALGLAFHVTPYYFVYALVLLGVVAAFRTRVIRAWLGRADARRGLATAAVLALVAVAPRALAMAAAAGGGVVVHHGPLNTELGAPLLETLVPFSSTVSSRAPRVGYLVVFVGYAWIGALALSLRWGGRAPGIAAWWAAAGVSLLLALGPWLKLAEGATTGVPLPALLVQRVPGFDLTTNHWRWTLAASFCIAVVLARAMTGLEQHFAATRPAFARTVVPCFALLYVLESALVWPLPFPRPVQPVEPSPVAAVLRDRTDVNAVLDRTDRRKLNQTVHGKPIALGWLPRIDRETDRANREMVAACRGRAPACLLRFGIDAVIQDPTTALLIREDGSVEEIRAPADVSR